MNKPQSETARSDRGFAITNTDVNAGERATALLRLRTAQLRWLLLSWKGRIDRKTFLLSVLLEFGVPAVVFVAIQTFGSGLGNIAAPVDVLGGLNGDWSPSTVVAAIIALPLFIWINWMIAIKRAHDFGRSWGALLIISFLSNIPYIGWLIACIPFVVPGTEGPNDFGDAAGWDSRPQ